jgi:hypothetical protein
MLSTGDDPSPATPAKAAPPDAKAAAPPATEKKDEVMALTICDGPADATCLPPASSDAAAHEGGIQRVERDPSPPNPLLSHNSFEFLKVWASQWVPGRATTAPAASTTSNVTVSGIAPVRYFFASGFQF